MRRSSSAALFMIPLSALAASSALASQWDQLPGRIEAKPTTKLMDLEKVLNKVRVAAPAASVYDIDLASEAGCWNYRISLIAGDLAEATTVVIDGESGKVRELDSMRADLPLALELAAVAELMPKAVISFSKAAEIAELQVADSKVVESSLVVRDGLLLYHVDVTTGGQVVEVAIDALTGEILGGVSGTSAQEDGGPDDHGGHGNDDVSHDNHAGHGADDTGPDDNGGASGGGGTDDTGPDDNGGASGGGGTDDTGNGGGTTGGGNPPTPPAPTASAALIQSAVTAATANYPGSSVWELSRRVRSGRPTVTEVKVIPATFTNFVLEVSVNDAGVVTQVQQRTVSAAESAEINSIRSGVSTVPAGSMLNFAQAITIAQGVNTDASPVKASYDLEHGAVVYSVTLQVGAVQTETTLSLAGVILRVR